jgi:cytochrome c oxidase subunit II
MPPLAEGAKKSMKNLSRLMAVVAGISASLAICGIALAGEGQPSPWEIGLQDPASPVMHDIVDFHNVLLWIITAISGFVLLLLLWVIVRFNARANPTPSRTTHNTFIEVIWTVLPVIILVGIAIPSFRLLFFQLNTPPADLTVKATGKVGWFWHYNYPDNGPFEYDSFMLKEPDRQKSKPNEPRLLAVDEDLVVPVNKVVRVLVTADPEGVIHSFAVPSFGIKIDAIPGRLNETWFKAEREGIYYGQCSELCGKDHAFMPIAVRVVSDKEFAAWLADAKKKFAQADSPSQTTVAAAATPRSE